MLAEVLRDRLAQRDFHPFTLVLVNGERIPIQQRDALAMPFTMRETRRIYAPCAVVVYSEGENVITRSISLPMISQVIDEHRLNGSSEAA